MTRILRSTTARRWAHSVGILNTCVWSVCRLTGRHRRRIGNQTFGLKHSFAVTYLAMLRTDWQPLEGCR
jgi:hypothetical protein